MRKHSRRMKPRLLTSWRRSRPHKPCLTMLKVFSLKPKKRRSRQMPRELKWSPLIKPKRKKLH